MGGGRGKKGWERRILPRSAVLGINAIFFFLCEAEEQWLPQADALPPVKPKLRKSGRLTRRPLLFLTWNRAQQLSPSVLETLGPLCPFLRSTLLLSCMSHGVFFPEFS